MNAIMTSRFVSVAVLSLSCVAPAAAQDVAHMDEAVQFYAKARRFMGAVLVARGDTVLLNKGYGSANLEWNEPVDPDTRFRIGSLTKQFTAAAILLLEERGRLSTSDPVRKYVPDAPAAWDAITLAQLLQHTSGIPNYTALPEFTTLQALQVTPERLIGLVRDKPLDFPPGQKWSYSNSGYIVLGYIIEKVTGEPYARFLEENIFTPLGMKASGYDSTTAVISHRADGYVIDANGALTNAPFIHPSFSFSAGALYSTTGDLLRWTRALFGGKLLAPQSLRKMRTPGINNYGMGVMVASANGRSVIEHAGGINGFNSYLGYFPDSDITVVVLANVAGPAALEIGGRLGGGAHGDAVPLPTERRETKLSSNVLTRYVGTYQVSPGFNVYVRYDDAANYLTVQLTGQARLPIYAETQTRFFLKSIDAQLEFMADDKGVVTHVILHQAGRQQNARKTSATVPERQAISLAPETLARYAGTYTLKPGFDLVISVENGQLVGRVGPQVIPLLAETQSRFFAEVLDVQVEFQTGQDGGVTSLIFQQGPGKVTAPRR